MQRRRFLTAIAALPLAPKRKPVVAAHPWVYAAPLPQHDITPVLDRIFDDMSWAGIEAIELMHTALRPDDSLQRIGELSRKFNLPVLGMSYEARMYDRPAHAAILDEAELLIGRLAKLGGRTLGASVGDARRRKTPEELDAQAEALRNIIAICERNRVVLNLHNHIYEVANGEYDLRGTLARVPGVKLGPDLDWLRGAGVDPVAFIRRHGSRIVFAHLRDRKADGTWSEAIGEGNTDFPAIGRALRDAGFEGDLAIELAHPQGFQLTRPLRESLKISREHIRKTLGY